MAKLNRVTLEIGPKGKKVVAVAQDWPGLERGANTEKDAVERLLSYVPRYSQVAKLADMDAEFAAIKNFDVVEQYPGTGSTDFWGISFAFSSIDKQAMSGEHLERELTLMQACWAFCDNVRRRVSAEMQKGPRGGGRDRDHIVRHTFAAEQDWAKMIGVLTPDGAMLTGKGLKAHREAYCRAIRDYWIYGVWGATIAGWGIFVIFIAHYPFRNRERWAWNCLVTGIIMWFVLDTSLSIFHKVYFNAAFNSVLLILAMLPIVITRKYFTKE